MNSEPICSVIICTHNRGPDLLQTLDSLNMTDISHSVPSELILVDNKSADCTSDIAHSFKLLNVPVRYVQEARQGKGYAYNAGISMARGQVLLFTDDDVRPPSNWVTGMCTPILEGRADAVAGGVKIAPHLERPWMSRTHRVWLASTEYMEEGTPEMVGANMAFSRAVLSRIPAFDPELGPGALGFGDETLFSLQLRAANYVIACKFDVAVEHHFSKSRLTRSSFLEQARKRGRSSAYISYNWKHKLISVARLRLLKALLRSLFYNLPWELAHWRTKMIPSPYIGLFTGYYFYTQYLQELKHPFNYEQYGLVKLRVADKLNSQ